METAMSTGTTYTISLELAVVVVGMIVAILPGAFWLGRFAQRLASVEAAQVALGVRVEAITTGVDNLRRELLAEIRLHTLSPRRSTDVG